MLRPLRAALLALPVLAACAAAPARSDRSGEPAGARPTGIVLLLADDMGWADLFGPENERPLTPALDRMRAEGVSLTRFYAAAPVCSPTRGSLITGRHPSRYGILGANSGHLPHGEQTLAELLGAAGFRTGFFGKWHLGTLTRETRESNRGGPRGVAHYSPPWEHGFDVTFATEAKVPTWDPMLKPGTDEPYGTFYWSGPEERVEGNLAGDDSRVIVDRVAPFLRDCVAAGEPFLAVVWFHSPHLPVIAGEPYRSLYPDHPAVDYRGTVTAMDHEIGRIRAVLDELGVAGDTLLWFASDNGPEVQGQARDLPASEYRSNLGDAAPLRGRKRSLYEGGIRVPAAVVWPAALTAGASVDVPLSTSDVLPTLLDALDLPGPALPLDGASGLGVLCGQGGTRPDAAPAIGFHSRKQAAWVEGPWKLYSGDEGESWELYDLVSDPGESRDLARAQPELLARLSSSWRRWREACLAR